MVRLRHLEIMMGLLTGKPMEILMQKERAKERLKERLMG